MENEKFREYLTQQNELCNVHMNIQSSKQDHIVTFYISLLTLFIASKEFMKLPAQDMLNVFLSAIMVVISIVLFCYLCSYVHWHKKFLNCANVISYIILSDKKINNYQQLCREVENAFKKIHYTGIHYSSQTILLTGYLFIASISYIFLLFDINKLLENELLWEKIIIIYLCVLVTSFFFAFLLYRNQIRKAYIKLPYILDFIHDFH